MTSFVTLASGERVYIDEDDYENVSVYSWSKYQRNHTIYAKTSVIDHETGKNNTIYLHRLVMSAQRGDIVDHRDGDGLNCRKENLRLATVRQNAQNSKSRKGTSLYKGVHWSTHFQRWEATLRVNGKQKYIGSFPTDRDAAIAYNKFASEQIGEFARLNVILDPSTALPHPI